MPPHDMLSDEMASDERSPEDTFAEGVPPNGMPPGEGEPPEGMPPPAMPLPPAGMPPGAIAPGAVHPPPGGMRPGGMPPRAMRMRAMHMRAMHMRAMQMRAMHAMTCHGRPPDPRLDDEPAALGPGPAAADADATRAARRLQVRRVDRGPTPPADLAAVRLLVAVDDAPFGSVAVAIADAAGTSVVVDPEVARARVTLAMRDASLETLLPALATAAGAVAGRNAGTIHFETPWRARLRARAALLAQEQSVVEVRLVPADGVRPGELAAAFCEMLASPRGSAAVIGRYVLVRDVPPVLSQLDALAHELHAPARRPGRPGAPPPRRPPPR